MCKQLLFATTSPASTHSKSTEIHRNKYVNKPCVDELRLTGVAWQVAQEVDLHAVNKHICQPKGFVFYFCFFRSHQEDCPVRCLHCALLLPESSFSKPLARTPLMQSYHDPWSDFATIMRIRPEKIQEFPCGSVTKNTAQKTHTLLLALFLLAKKKPLSPAVSGNYFTFFPFFFFFKSPNLQPLSKDLQLQQEQVLRGSETMKYSDALTHRWLSQDLLAVQ